MGDGILAGLGIAAAVLWFGLLVAGVIGWVMNLLTLIGLGLDPFTAEAGFRLAGVFFVPIGAVLGYF